MINESTWGYRQELKTHSLKLARRILVCVGSSAFLWSWSPSEEDSQPTQASCEHSGGNTTKLRNNSRKKTKGVFCIWCLFAKQWTSLLLKKGWLSCQKCYTPLALGKKVTGYCKWRWKQKESWNCIFIPTCHLKCCWGISDQITDTSRSSSQIRKKNFIVYTFPTALTVSKEEDRPNMSTPRNAFCGLRLRATEMLRTACSPVLKLLVEDIHGRGRTTNPVVWGSFFFFPIGQLFR